MKKIFLSTALLLALLMVGCTAPQPSPAPSTQTGTTLSQNQGTTGDQISESQAKEIALKHAGVTEDKVTFIKAYLSRDDGKLEYEIEFYLKGENKEFDYDINAITGEITSFDQDIENYDIKNPNNNQSGNEITLDDAKKIALDRVPGANESNIIKIEEDYDDGIKKIEGEIIYNGMEYEFEINKSSGTIIKWEKEQI